MFSPSSYLSKMASRTLFLLLVSCLAAVGFFLAPPILEAQSDTLSTPLSDSLGDPVYSESDITGPSTSLFQGSNSLVTPYLRTGISDPLDFLIESSSLSPYNPGASLVGGYVIDSYVDNQVIVDATVASRFSEYQNNRYLMSGVATGGSLAGRAAAAGGLLASNQGTAMTAAAASAFSSLTVRAPFAAGSSLLAGRQSALSSSGTFMDPNAMVSALTSSTTLNSMQADTTGNIYGAAEGIPATDPSTSDGSSNEFGTSAGVSYAMLASVPAGMLVPPPDSTAIGPAPGSVFMDVTMAGPSATGFQDSTMGTAGLAMQIPDESTSPLASPYVESSDTPFQSMSDEQKSFLHPTLIVDASSDPQAEEAGVLSLSEATRKARLHAMIYNPQGTPLPSPFEQRAMQREFLRNKNKRRVSHYPALTAPSVTP